MLTMANPDNGL